MNYKCGKVAILWSIVSTLAVAEREKKKLKKKKQTQYSTPRDWTSKTTADETMTERQKVVKKGA